MEKVDGVESGKPQPQEMDMKEAVQHDEQPERSLLRSILIIVACTLTMIANSSNNTIVSIALPTLEHELHMMPPDLQWVVSGYSLSSCCLLLLLGRLADLYGRKKMFMAGSLWLVAFALGCGFVNDCRTLNVLRGIQGVGAAATIPAAVGIIAQSFPPGKMRAIAFASFGAGGPVGAAMGMALGGVLIEFTTWRAIFWFSAGLMFLSIVVGLLAFDKDRPSTEPDQRVDWIGAMLVTVGLVLFVFALSQGEIAGRLGWRSPYIIICMIAGILFVIGFVFWEHYLTVVNEDKATPSSSRHSSWLPNPPPLMPLSLWKRANGRAAVVMCIACLIWACFLAWNFWALLYYQDFTHLTALQTVVRLIPMFVTGVLCNVFVALVVGRLPLVYLIGFGAVCTSLAALLFALIRPSDPYWAYGFPAAILAVFGVDFVTTAGTMFIAKISLPHEQSVAGGTFQCMTQLGTTLGIAISTVAFDSIARKNGPPPPPFPPSPSPLPPPPPGGPPSFPHHSDRLEPYHTAQWTTFAFGAFAFVLAVAFLRGVAAVGKRDPEPKEENKN